MWRRLRLIVCRHLLGSCGRNVNIESQAYFGSGKNIFIGDNSGIGVNAYLVKTVRIGKNVMMGQDVIILTMNHKFSRTDTPMIEQGLQEEMPVKIVDDVWICVRVIILPGVTIGSGAIIGAGTVVSKDVPDWAIVAGSSARILRYRKTQNECN